ncbi:hypothetical protein JB92DRAFT_3097507 [Gautieria morchelliformis]|nr:hypothetical protein JB92DRAFT_3097507 [Gautieria morchelliformis]
MRPPPPPHAPFSFQLPRIPVRTGIHHAHMSITAPAPSSPATQIPGTYLDPVVQDMVLVIHAGGIKARCQRGKTAQGFLRYRVICMWGRGLCRRPSRSVLSYRPIAHYPITHDPVGTRSDPMESGVGVACLSSAHPCQHSDIPTHDETSIRSESPVSGR